MSFVETEIDGQIINTYFSVVEKMKGEVKKNYEITIETDKNYAVSSSGDEFEIKPGQIVIFCFIDLKYS